MSYANFTDKSGPGGVVHNPASRYAREMAKWEMGYSPYGPPGRPRETVGFQEYPALFYKMKRSSTNGDFLVEDMVSAADEVAGRNLESRGYRCGRVAAIEAVTEHEQELAVMAANRNYQDRNMSERAKAELAAAEAATSGHLAEVPATPIVRRRKADAGS